MENKFFLVQVKHTNNAWEKGVVVKDTLNDARQGYHAYLGAYGYGKDGATDYVQCCILNAYGVIQDVMVDDRRAPIAQEESDI